jgi:hypothetical protein
LCEPAFILTFGYGASPGRRAKSSQLEAIRVPVRSSVVDVTRPNFH